MNKDPFIRMCGISKRFGGIMALNNVDLEIYPGEVLGLMGENGAGKSTLMRVLCGIQDHDEGSIRVSGKEVHITSPQSAQELGIGMIPQELLLVESMSAGENIFLGYEPLRKSGLVDKKEIYSRSSELLGTLGCSEINPDMELSLVSKADQQMIAIARRMIQGGKIFIMDEPTSSLTEQETRKLFSVIRSLCSEGKSVIFISHRLEEVLEICDRVVILRDGENAAVLPNDENMSKQLLITHMIGSELAEEYPHEAGAAGEELLKIDSLSFVTAQGETIKNINLTVNAREVLGIAGLVGVGKSELAQTMTGIRKKKSGTFFMDGVEVNINSPVRASQLGIGYVTEDRRGEGLVLGLKSLFNMTLRALNRISSWGFINGRKEESLGLDYAKKLNMKSEYLEIDAGNLSGGNQQKVVVIKQMASDSRIIIFDEPTKGVDVGAKAEIARLINQLSSEGKGICIFSSEPREVLGISDKIYVLTHKGMSGPYRRDEIDYTSLMEIEFGGVE